MNGSVLQRDSIVLASTAGAPGSCGVMRVGGVPQRRLQHPPIEQSRFQALPIHLPLQQKAADHGIRRKRRRHLCRRNHMDRVVVPPERQSKNGRINTDQNLRP